MTQTASEILQRLRVGDRVVAADDLTRLMRLGTEDPEEPPMRMFSLRDLATFLLDHPQVPTPQMGVDPDGRLVGDWDLGPTGFLVLRFVRPGRIEFAACSDIRSAPRQRRELHGEDRADRAVQKALAFVQESGGWPL